MASKNKKIKTPKKRIPTAPPSIPFKDKITEGRKAKHKKKYTNEEE